MISISRKTDYALVALARLAGHGQEDDRPLSCRQIADTYEFPLQQLMSVLKQLQRAGLVKSTRGPQGGYRLAVLPEQLPLTRVIEAIEGPMKITACCEEDEQDACQACRLVPQCPITTGIRWINEQIYQVIGRYTLADLLQKSPDSAPSHPVELVVASQALLR